MDTGTSFRWKNAICSSKISKIAGVFPCFLLKATLATDNCDNRYLSFGKNEDFIGKKWIK